VSPRGRGEGTPGPARAVRPRVGSRPGKEGKKKKKGRARCPRIAAIRQNSWGKGRSRCSFRHQQGERGKEGKRTRGLRASRLRLRAMSLRARLGEGGKKGKRGHGGQRIVPSTASRSCPVSSGPGMEGGGGKKEKGGSNVCPRMCSLYNDTPRFRVWRWKKKKKKRGVPGDFQLGGRWGGSGGYPKKGKKGRGKALLKDRHGPKEEGKRLPVTPGKQPPQPTTRRSGRVEPGEKKKKEGRGGGTPSP